jgi:hypothetical protein
MLVLRRTLQSANNLFSNIQKKIIMAELLSPCQLTVNTLEAAFLRHPGQAPTSAGAHEALTSDINRSSVFTDQVINSNLARPTDTSNRKVQVTYVPASCDEDFDFDKCDLGSNAAPSFLATNYEADLSHGWAIDLNENQYRDLCEGDVNGVYSKMFLSKYQQAKAQYNAKIAAVLATLPGNYPTDGADSLASPIALPVLTSAGMFNSGTFAYHTAIWRAANILDQPIVLYGAGYMDAAIAAYGITATTDAGMARLSALPPLYRDSAINAAFGDGSSHIISWARGAVQLLEWYENFGGFGWREDMTRNGSTVAKSERSTIMTPDGISWDFYYEFDCGVHKFRFKKFFGVAAIPSDAFGECRDYNYILNFTQACGDLTCEDLESLNPAIPASS